MSGAPRTVLADRPTVHDAIAWAARELRESGRDAPWPSAEQLLAQVMGRARLELLAHPEIVLDGEAVCRFRAKVSRRARGEPLAYLLGHREFYGIEFAVGPGVLIPRPETELLVEWALQELEEGCGSDRTPWIVDLGCGSGNILGAVLSTCAAARGLGVDREAAALAWARRNLTRLGLMARARLVAGNMGEGLARRGVGFDLIVSNPPYVQPEEGPSLAVEIRDHEPASALLVPDNDPWFFIQALREAAERLLRPGGLLLIEIGQGQAGETAARLTASPHLVLEGVREDLAGIERVVGARVISGARLG